VPSRSSRTRQSCQVREGWSSRRLDDSFVVSDLTDSAPVLRPPPPPKQQSKPSDLTLLPPIVLCLWCRWLSRSDFDTVHGSYERRDVSVVNRFWGEKSQVGRFALLLGRRRRSKDRCRVGQVLRRARSQPREVRACPYCREISPSGQWWIAWTSIQTAKDIELVHAIHHCPLGEISRQ
jgi:hypothetical protein